jgi:hypothetical protein
MHFCITFFYSSNMSLKKYSFLLLLVINLQAFAQDTLIDIYGKQYIGKVASRADRYVLFQSGDQLLTFREPTVGIVLSPRGEERFNWHRYRVYTDTHIQVKDFKRNVIAINTVDFAFTSLTISYEHILKSGNVSIKIPVSMGLGGVPDTMIYTGRFEQITFARNKNFSMGFELNYYPNGQTRHNYYVGISALAGSFFYYPGRKDTLYSYYYPGQPYYVINPGNKHYGTHYAGMIHLGGNLGVNKHFAIGGKLAIGFRREETIIEDYTRFKIQADITLAYKF